MSEEQKLAKQQKQEERKGKNAEYEVSWDVDGETREVSTIGYGMCRKEELIARLKEAFPDGGTVLDIRNAGSQSYNRGSWAYWGADMKATCAEAGMEYETLPNLGHKGRNTKGDMAKYEDELVNGWRRPTLGALVRLVRDNPKVKYCLLCAERKPYMGKLLRPSFYKESSITKIGSWSGKTNCHRTIVATNVTARLWFDHHIKAEVIHIYSERPSKREAAPQESDERTEQ